MAQKFTHLPLVDTHQSPWALAAIQLTGMVSLPVLAASVLIVQNTNFISAVLTLIIGNILLWVIRWGILSMSYIGRKSALDIARDYVGHFGSYFIAILLLAATLAWFVAQTTLASNALTYLVPVGGSTGTSHFVRVSVFIGVASTLFCMQGIVVLRRLSIIAFPILIIAFLGVIFASPQQLPSIQYKDISLSGLALVLGTSLGVTADLPTFFRHSRSWRASLRALTTIQIVSLVIGIGGLFLGSVIAPWFGVNQAQAFVSGSSLLKIFLIVLILVSVICANVSNIYSASVGWELVAPTFLVGRKEYLILGLGLTTIFILIANIISIDFLLNTSDSALVNLCMVLIVGYIVRLLTLRSPDVFEQTTYFIAWFLASALNILQFLHFLPEDHGHLALSIVVILVVTCLGMVTKRILKKKQIVDKG